MIYTRTPINTALPVTLADVKDHLRVTHTLEDALITRMIWTAALEFEDQCGIALLATTITATSAIDPGTDLELPIGPVATGATITVEALAEDGTTAPITAYWLEADLSDGRRKSLRGLLEFLRQEAGDLPFGRFASRHVEALMAKKAGPVAANNVKKTLSLLFNFAIKHELADQKINPARLADRRKENADGFHTWTDAEIAKFLDHHGPGTKARRALMIFLRTGAARQDAAAMGWQNVKDGRIRYRRGKTGVEADLPIMADLAAELRHVPASDLLFLTHSKGKPYKPETLGMWFKDQCIAAGLTHCTAHGLRKAGATQIADVGGNELQIMAFLAHATPKEGATYTKRASRAGLADAGMAKLVGSNPERNLSNLPTKLDKGAS